MRRQLDNVLAHQEILVMLCRHKARPPVIRDLVPDTVPENYIYNMYRKVNETPPPQGQLPQEIRTFLTAPKRRLQATVAVCAFQKLENIVEDHAMRYINAYTAYVRVFGEDALYDFNRVWFLLRQYQLRRLGVGKCLHCGHQYVFNREDVSDFKKCPICSILKLQPSEAEKEMQESGPVDFSFGKAFIVN